MAPPRNPLGRQRRAWAHAREQAKFRGLAWSLTWEQWWGFWEPHWSRRGRGRDNLVMMRLDPDEGWHDWNVDIVTRYDYLRRNREYRTS